MSIFSKNKTTRVKRNKFNKSHERKLSINMGYLYPILCEEVIPADHFRVSTESLIRFHPMVAPIMHRIDAYIHYFFVPYRLVWDGWNDFITGGPDGKNTSIVPTMTISNDNKQHFKKGALADYFGIPAMDPTVPMLATEAINALPFRAYHTIYNEYYRDQTLTPEATVTKNDTVDFNTEGASLASLRKRSWKKDYFTSALPWTQRGDEILIPIEGKVTYLNESLVKASSDGLPISGALSADADGDLATSGIKSRIENIEGVTNAVTTINDLRKSIHLQKWLEKNARAGARIVEFVFEHFGIHQDDLRMSRPQYLGGGRSNITISEVLATFGNDTIAQGTMAGHGVGVGNTNYFNKGFNEHGVILGILSVTPQPSYQQGIPKMFSHLDKFEYPFPEFANLGEQAIINKELYFDTQSNNGDNNLPFGYTPRYAEYKFGINSVHGDFRDDLSFWHGGRIFSNRPTLNAQFIECDTTSITNRIFPVTDSEATDKLYCQIYNNVKVLRCLPVFGTPTL
ncbi:MAG: major capsid protein [Microviridae sp.]|nr:MAG: major capsid protein [Microviridae sp.]